MGRDDTNRTSCNTGFGELVSVIYIEKQHKYPSEIIGVYRQSQTNQEHMKKRKWVHLKLLKSRQNPGGVFWSVLWESYTQKTPLSS